MDVIRAFIELAGWVESHNLRRPRVVLVFKEPLDAARAQHVALSSFMRPPGPIRTIAGLKVDFISEADLVEKAHADG